MIVARHWVRDSAEAVDVQGAVHRAHAWGWSSDSDAEARQRAKISAGRMAEWLAAWRKGALPPGSREYMYLLDRPPREEIVQEFRNAARDTIATVTRNSYGALILNARDLMFVDVDLPPPKLDVGKLIGRLFGKNPPATTPDEAILDQIRRWSEAHADFGLRIYRTAAGFRVAIVDRPMVAGADDSRAIMRELDGDPLYERLCTAQRCFRARLTPKPWRMQLAAPPTRWPFADAATASKYLAWQREYDAAAAGFAACRFVEQLGPRADHEELAPLVELHDAMTGCGRELALA